MTIRLLAIVLASSCFTQAQAQPSPPVRQAVQIPVGCYTFTLAPPQGPASTGGFCIEHQGTVDFWGSVKAHLHDYTLEGEAVGLVTGFSNGQMAFLHFHPGETPDRQHVWPDFMARVDRRDDGSLHGEATGEGNAYAQFSAEPVR